MYKKLEDFIAQSKVWLFNVEAELSLGNAKNLSEAEIEDYLQYVDVLFMKAYNFYGFDFNIVLVEFPLMEERYKIFAHL